MKIERYAIIDIGSNSIRLVIYEKTEQNGFRIIDGGKRGARLSGKMDPSGALTTEGIVELIETLKHFLRICSKHTLKIVKAVATAAIRNATNQAEILLKVEQATQLKIRLLTGEEEAAYGFLGMINSLQVTNGFLIDIGGGSSELTLFKNRKIVSSYSFPFGCVSLNKKYSGKDTSALLEIQHLKEEVKAALSNHSWIQKSPHLPLIAVGGTARALAKIHQSIVHYPYAQTHNYSIQGNEVNQILERLRVLPFDKRKKEPGLSKDRVDVIVPGLAIMSTIFDAIQGSHYTICAAGLRDGLFHEVFFPNDPIINDPLQYSIQNLLALHTAIPKPHVNQVKRLSLQLLEALWSKQPLGNKAEIMLLLENAALLHRIGATIDYYDYAKHSFYLILHSRINGMTHRQILLLAAIASYRSKNKVRSQLTTYRSLISEEDMDTIYKLGVILQLAAALDRSETQSIQRLHIECDSSALHLYAYQPKNHLKIEQHEVQELSSDFKKHWGLRPYLHIK